MINGGKNNLHVVDQIIIVKLLVCMISLQSLHINRVKGDITEDTKSSDLLELTDPMFEFQKVRFVPSHFKFSVST